VLKLALPKGVAVWRLLRLSAPLPYRPFPADFGANLEQSRAQNPAEGLGGGSGSS
jgi:hypothetical protein